MGLDNGFVINSKKHSDCHVEFAYFRKFYELDDWCRRNCQRTNEHSDYEYIVTKENVELLHKTIEPVVIELLKYGFKKVAFFDDNGYPKKCQVQFCNSEFNPSCSRSYFAGTKLRRLYFALETMLEIFEFNGDDVLITFYSSY